MYTPRDIDCPVLVQPSYSAALYVTYGMHQCSIVLLTMHRATLV